MSATFSWAQPGDGPIYEHARLVRVVGEIDRRVRILWLAKAPNTSSLRSPKTAVIGSDLVSAGSSRVPRY